MKSIFYPKLGLLVLTLAVGGLTLAGCTSADRPSCCPSLHGYGCGWDFYKPKDLIEGRAEREGRNLCGTGCSTRRSCDLCAGCGICGVRPGIRLGATTVVSPATTPATTPAAAPASEAPANDATESAPAAEDAGSGDAGTADGAAEFGLPPAR